MTVQTIGCLRIDRAGVQNEATEGRLDVAARTAEAVVEIEVAKGGIEIIAPQQADHAAPEPDAFRISGRSVQDPLGFGEFIDLLGVFGRIRPRGAGLVRGLPVRGPALFDVFFAADFLAMALPPSRLLSG